MSTISETRTALPTGTWQVDPVHSTVGFSVKHMVVANFRGGFDTFSVTLDETGLRGTVDVALDRRLRAEPQRPPALAGLLRRRAQPAALVQRRRRSASRATSSTSTVS